VTAKRVLFVCIGNAIRSQFAEAFARTYGKDVIVPLSAGLYPATNLAPFTVQVLGEKKIPLDDLFPKSIETAMKAPVDILVNISGEKVPKLLAPTIIEWKVPDPMGQKIDAYRSAATQIEMLVMKLILELRAQNS
jgi:protein-tyrosine-phosphatase